MPFEVILLLQKSPLLFPENERRVDEDMRDIKQIKDELREKRIRVKEIEVFFVALVFEPPCQMIENLFFSNAISLTSKCLHGAYN